MLEAAQCALLRLFDLGLVRFVEAPEDVGYTAKRDELPGIGRDELLAVFEEDRNHSGAVTDTQIWFDATPEGEAVLDAVPIDRIPRVSGLVRRPWLD